MAPDGTIPAGQALVVGLLEQLFEEAHDLMASTDSISESLTPIAERLKEIKGQLERLSLTHRWTLRETDLYTFQVRQSFEFDLVVKVLYLVAQFRCSYSYNYKRLKSCE